MTAPAPPSVPTPEPRLWAACWRHGVRWRVIYALLASLVIFALSSFPATLPRGIPGIDKAAHLLAYFILSLAYLNVTTGGWQRAGLFRVAAGALAAALYGLSDEWHQAYVPGRHFDWADLAADGIGALAAAALTGPMARVARTAAPAGEPGQGAFREG